MGAKSAQSLTEREAALGRLGASARIARRLAALDAPAAQLRLGRIAEDRGVQYIVAFDPHATPNEALAECAPEMLRAFKKGRAPRPVVGDWVWTRAPKIDRNPHLIEHLVPRWGWFSRRRPHSVEEQVLAANADLALLVAAVGPDFNPRRLERYIAAASAANAEAIIVLAKTDLEADLSAYRARLEGLVPPDNIVLWSAVTMQGIEDIRERLAGGHTAALLGSSGVGKSTLINRLLGEERLDTSQVRRDGKGRHTTTRRQLVVLETGGVLIDTPGIRELALFDADQGVVETFDEVERVTEGCRFSNCRHAQEPGCAVVAAVRAGELDAGRVASYLKLRDELAESAKTLARRKRGPKGSAKSTGRGPKPTPRRARKRRDADQD